MNPETELDLEPLTARVSDRRARRGGWAALAVGLAAATVMGVGCGAWLLFEEWVTPPRASSVRTVPLVEMPEIRNGVPALATSRPGSTGTPDGRSQPRGPDGAPRTVRTVSTSPPTPPAPDATEADAANAKALARTEASLSLRPGLTGRSGGRPSAEPDPASVSAEPPVGTTGSVPEGAGAAAPAERSPPPRTALPNAKAPVPSREPESVVRAEPSSEPPPAASSDPVPASAGAARTSETPSEAAAPPSRAAKAPLPPTRPAQRAADADRPPASAGRSRPAASTAAAPPNQPGSAPASRPAQERAEIFGLPLPGFVPTGRRIREVAGDVVDTVVSLPDRF